MNVCNFGNVTPFYKEQTLSLDSAPDTGISFDERMLGHHTLLVFTR